MSLILFTALNLFSTLTAGALCLFVISISVMYGCSYMELHLWKLTRACFDIQSQYKYLHYPHFLVYFCFFFQIYLLHVFSYNYLLFLVLKMSSSLTAFHKTASGKPFSKDHESIFAMLILSLPLTSPHSSNSNATASQKRSKIPLFSSTKKPIPYSFLLHDALTCIQNMSVKIVTGSTKTTITCSVPESSACIFIQRFISARLLHCPSDRTASKCLSSSSSDFASFSKSFLLQPTAKGVYLLERYCRKNGIDLSPDSPALQLIQSTYNSMRSISFDRNPITDDLICNEAFVFLLFQRLMGPVPNVYSASNPPDKIPPLTTYSFDTHDLFGKHDLALYSPLDDSGKFSFKNNQNSISLQSPYAHRFFTHPDSEALTQYYVSSVGVRLFENKLFDVYVYDPSLPFDPVVADYFSSEPAVSHLYSQTTSSTGRAHNDSKPGCASTSSIIPNKIETVLVDYCFTGRTLWQWLLDCTDIIYQREAIHLANLFFKSGMLEPIYAVGSMCVPGDERIKIAKDAFYRLSKVGKQVAAWPQYEFEEEQFAQKEFNQSKDTFASTTETSKHSKDFEKEVKKKKNMFDMLSASIKGMVKHHSSHSQNQLPSQPFNASSDTIQSSSNSDTDSSKSLGLPKTVEVDEFSPWNVSFPSAPLTPSQPFGETGNQENHLKETKDAGQTKHDSELEVSVTHNEEISGTELKEQNLETFSKLQLTEPDHLIQKSLGLKKKSTQSINISNSAILYKRHKLSNSVVSLPNISVIQKQSDYSVSGNFLISNKSKQILSDSKKSDGTGVEDSLCNSTNHSSTNLSCCVINTNVLTIAADSNGSETPNKLTLYKIVQDAALRFLFREFLLQQHCEENLQFYSDLSRFLVDFDQLEVHLSSLKKESEKQLGVTGCDEPKRLERVRMPNDDFSSKASISQNTNFTKRSASTLFPRPIKRSQSPTHSLEPFRSCNAEFPLSADSDLLRPGNVSSSAALCSGKSPTLDQLKSFPDTQDSQRYGPTTKKGKRAVSSSLPVSPPNSSPSSSSTGSVSPVIVPSPNIPSPTTLPPEVHQLYQTCLNSLYIMYHRYLALQAPCELNIDSTLRHKLVETMTSHINVLHVPSQFLFPAPANIPKNTNHSAFTYFSSHKSLTQNIKVLREMAALLTAAQSHVFKTMENDSLPKFIESSVFRNGMSVIDSLV